jgi:agmatine deiminase
MSAAEPLRMPAEWERHERCLMGWPSRAELWGERLERAKLDYAAVANAIADHEPVLMLARREDVITARSACAGAVEVIELPLDDSWLRDSGPLFAREASGALVGVDFTFNAWGEKFRPYEQDARLAARLLERLGIPRRPVALVLEGGAITVDGQGTLITTESVLCNPNRNPGRSRDEIEAVLGQALGAERVIWLTDGLVEDRDTDGHVDNVCHFLSPGRVIVQAVTDPDNVNFERLAANRDQLRSATDARGRRLEVLELPQLPYLPDGDRPTVAPYLNFYLANGAVIVPVSDPRTDADALAIISAALPDRVVVPVPGATLAHGGGGVHCITQQQPAVGGANGAT